MKKGKFEGLLFVCKQREREREANRKNGRRSRLFASRPEEDRELTSFDGRRRENANQGPSFRLN